MSVERVESVWITAVFTGWFVEIHVISANAVYNLIMNHPDLSGLQGLVNFLSPESELNMEKQHSVIMLQNRF